MRRKPRLSRRLKNWAWAFLMGLASAAMISLPSEVLWKTVRSIWPK